MIWVGLLFTDAVGSFKDFETIFFSLRCAKTWVILAGWKSWICWSIHFRMTLDYHLNKKWIKEIILNLLRHRLLVLVNLTCIILDLWEWLFVCCFCSGSCLCGYSICYCFVLRLIYWVLCSDPRDRLIQTCWIWHGKSSGGSPILTPTSCTTTKICKGTVVSSDKRASHLGY